MTHQSLVGPLGSPHPGNTRRHSTLPPPTVHVHTLLWTKCEKSLVEWNKRVVYTLFFYKQCFFSAEAEVLLIFKSIFAKIYPTLPSKSMFKMLFGISTVSLHQRIKAVINDFLYLHLWHSKSQPSVAYKSVAYKKKRVV